MRIASPRTSRLLAFVLSLGIAPACRFDAGALDGRAACATDDQCAGLRCVEGYCTSQGVDAGGWDSAADAPADGDPDSTDAGLSDAAPDSPPDDGVPDSDPDLSPDPGDSDTPDADTDVAPELGPCSLGQSDCAGSALLHCDETGSWVVDVNCSSGGQCLDLGAGCTCSEGACVARQCIPGAQRCDGDIVLGCDGEGATWEEVDLCFDGTACAGGECVPTACDGGWEGCVGEQIAACSSEGTIEPGRDCAASGSRCEASGGVAACVDRVCEPLETRCSIDDAGVETCDERGARWSDPVPCGGALHCSSGLCIDEICLPSSETCEGDFTMVACNADGTDLVRTACDPGFYCSDNVAGASCVAQLCPPGARQCSFTGAPELCDDRGSAWITFPPCGAGSACVDGSCVPRTCEPDSRTCLDLFTVLACDATGLDGTPEDCRPGGFCDDAGGVAECAPQACVPDVRDCLNLSQPRTCSPSGSTWIDDTRCNDGFACVAGLCADQVCSPSSSECVDDFTRGLCDGTGTVYTEADCPPDTFCDGGACVPRICAPAALFCTSTGDVGQCNAIGSDFTVATDCPYACAGAACTGPLCGDGVLTTSNGERCDDGNAAACDGCEACSAFSHLVVGPGFSSSTSGAWVPGTSDLSVDAWVRVDTIDDGNIAGLGRASEDYVALALDDGVPYFIFNMGSGRVIRIGSSAGSVAGTGWHHLAGERFGESGAAVFVDGVMTGIVWVDSDFSRIDGSGRLWVGSEGSFTPFRGAVDELRFSSIARFPGEGFALVRSLAPDGSTVAAYHMDEGSGPTITGASGGNPMTLTAATWGVDSCFGGSPTAISCGDGARAPWEACDDGNLVGGDGCSPSCAVEVPACSNSRGPAGHCYRWVDTDRHWDQAEADCVSWGGHLVTVDNVVESDWLTILSGQNEFWIGFNDRAAEGAWVWSSSSTSPYRRWNGGEPNNVGDEDCAISYVNGLWNDVQCNDNRPWICER